MIDIPSIILLLTLPGVCWCVNGEEFKEDETLSDKVCPPANRVFELLARGLISCVAVAAGMTSSVGVSYHGDSNMCYGSEVDVNTTGQFITLPGAVFYKKVPEGFVHVSGYTLNFVKDVPLIYAAAADACATTGYLVKINSLEKQSFIRSYLNDPKNGLDNTRYWIQGRRDDTNVWRFDDGTLMPMSEMFWAPDEPTSDDETCCEMWAWKSFLWNNIDCHIYTRGYICELM